MCRAFTSLSFYSIFKNPSRAHSIRELKQDNLGKQLTPLPKLPAVGSLFLKKMFPGAASVSKATDLLLWTFIYFPVKRLTASGSETDCSAKVFFASNQKFQLCGVCTLMCTLADPKPMH